MNTTCKNLHENEIQTVATNISQEPDIEQRFKAVVLKIGRATKKGAKYFLVLTKKAFLALERWSAEGARIHNVQRMNLDERYAAHAHHIRMI